MSSPAWRRGTRGSLPARGSRSRPPRPRARHAAVHPVDDDSDGAAEQGTEQAEERHPAREGRGQTGFDLLGRRSLEAHDLFIELPLQLQVLVQTRGVLVLGAESLLDARHLLWDLAGQDPSSSTSAMRCSSDDSSCWTSSSCCCRSASRSSETRLTSSSLKALAMSAAR